MEKADKYWNPYLAGVVLGLVLLATFLIAGKGLGASGAANRFAAVAVGAVAPGHVQNHKSFGPLAEGRKGFLDDWLVFEVLGVFLGGLLGAFTAGRLRRGVTRGPRASVQMRLTLALTGGLIMGVAARLARGCTSGQALSGGALLSSGSWIFMMAMFVGGYGMAYFVRRQWT